MPAKHRDKLGRTRTRDHAPAWCLDEIERLRADVDQLRSERALLTRIAVAAVAKNAVLRGVLSGAIGFRCDGDADA